MSSFKVSPKGCDGLRLNVKFYTLNFFLNSRGRNIHFLVLTYGDGMPSCLLKESRRGKLEDSNIYVTNSIHANYM